MAYARGRERPNDLVDVYVRGGLAGETLERFKSFYLTSAKRLEKVSFARTFLVLSERATAVRRPASRWRWLAAPAWAFACAALLVLLAGGYLLYDDLRLRNQMIEAQAERAALRQRATPEAATAKPAPAKTGAPPNAVSAAAVVLFPQTRGIGPIATVTVPAGLERISFQLNLESDDFAEYRVALKDPAARQTVWRSGRLTARSRGEDRAVLVRLLTSLLKQQNYSLELTGIRGGGATEFAGSYAFRVAPG